MREVLPVSADMKDRLCQLTTAEQKLTENIDQTQRELDEKKLTRNLLHAQIQWLRERMGQNLCPQCGRIGCMGHD